MIFDVFFSLLSRLLHHLLLCRAVVCLVEMDKIKNAEKKSLLR